MFKLCCLPNICIVSWPPLQSREFILLISKDWGGDTNCSKMWSRSEFSRKTMVSWKKKKRATEFIQANAVPPFAWSWQVFNQNDWLTSDLCPKPQSGLGSGLNFRRRPRAVLRRVLRILGLVQRSVRNTAGDGIARLIAGPSQPPSWREWQRTQPPALLRQSLLASRTSS